MLRLPLSLVVWLAVAAPAFAHKLIVNAAPKGDRLRVEAYYEDDTPAEDAKVTVTLGDRIVAEGTTDDRGLWSCPLPADGTYLVKVVSAGHVGRATVEIGGPIPTTEGDETAVDPAKRTADTRTPWGKLVFGLGLIAAVALGGWVLRRPARARPETLP